jgi:hypothetical protein
MKKNFSSSIIFWILVFAFVQVQAQTKPFTVAFYNLENLFDTLKDIGKEDYEFLPTSKRHWDSKKYHQKMHLLARAIASIDSSNWQGPDILGVCEVEHKSCLDDLVSKTALAHFGYTVLHQESNDERGIDVACIYKKDQFQLIDYHYFAINFDFETRPTRDILYLKGILPNQDTLHLFYNHWPSRMGGQLASEPKRFIAAKRLKQLVDSIYAVSQYPKIIISGDFNDGPTNASLTEALGTSNFVSDTARIDLFNTSYYLQKVLKIATHKYQDEWNLFDQIIISAPLLDAKSSTFCNPQKDSKIHNQQEWLSEQDLNNGGIKPRRSYVGTKYNHGYSDHYAVFLTLWLTKK